MQYVWQHRLLIQTDLTTVDGRSVTIIDPGRLNTNAGPDFFNAKVKIGDKMWAGDVEIHVRASDWHRHGHDGDKAYDSVVLHVVDRDDAPISRSNGEVIPQMVMRCAPDFHSRYSQLVDRADIDLPCAPDIKTLHQLHLTDWITSLAYERVYSKADHMLELLDRYTGDWEQVCYIVLARALGFGVNSEPMERLAISLPLQFLRKHSDSLTALEALMFGQGGFLAKGATDAYMEHLQKEHQFFAHKFALKPLQPLGWKMGRMRPQNLPHRRIAILAQMVSNDFRLVRRILTAETTDQLIELFRQPLSGYWANRYTFGAPSERTFETLSRASAHVLIINVAVPLLVAYGSRHGDSQLVERGFDWLHSLPSESNHIVSMFAVAGLHSSDAFTSQALIQLRRVYCEQRRCIYCRLGHKLLAARAKR